MTIGQMTQKKTNRERERNFEFESPDTISLNIATATTAKYITFISVWNKKKVNLKPIPIHIM